jgi:hypothetical protein
VPGSKITCDNLFTLLDLLLLLLDLRKLKLE